MFFTTLAQHNLILLYDGRDKFDEESGEDGADGEDSSDEDIPNRPPPPPSAAPVIKEVIVNEVDVQEGIGVNLCLCVGKHVHQSATRRVMKGRRTSDQ